MQKSRLVTNLIIKTCSMAYTQQVFKDLKRIGFNSKFTPNFEDISNKINASKKTDPPTIEDYNGLILHWVLAKKYDLAQSLYEKLAQEKDVVPDINTYSAMIRLWIQTDKISQANQVIRDMENANVEKNLEIYHSLLMYYSKRADLRNFDRVVSELKESKLSLTNNSYHIILLFYYVNNLLLQFQENLKEFRSQGVKFNSHVYNIIISFFLKIDQIASVNEVIADMEQEDITVDHVTFNNILKHYVQTKNVTNIEEMWNEMDKRKILAVSSYNIMLDWCCTNRDLAQFEKMFEIAKQKGMVDVTSYNTYLHICARMKKLDLMQKVYQTMKESNITPDAFTFSTMLQAYKETKKFDMMERVCEELSKSGAQNLTYIHNIASQTVGSLTDPSKYPNLMNYATKVSMEPGKQDNCVTLTIALNKAITDQNWQQAEQIFQQMKNVTLNKIAYTSILNYFAHARKYDMIDTVLHEMKQRGIVMDPIAYNTLIKLYCDMNDMPKIKKLLGEIIQNQVYTSKEAVEVVLRYATRKDKMQIAFEMFAAMKEFNTTPDFVTYHTLIHGCCRINDMRSARLIFDQVLLRYPDQVKPSLFEALIHGYRRLKMYRESDLTQVELARFKKAHNL